VPKLEKSTGRGWFGESRRHSLAAKGISTKEEARLRYYQTQSLETRIKDESKKHSEKEILKVISNKKFSPESRKFIAKWALEPQKYDISGIDDPLPKGFTVEHKNIRKANPFTELNEAGRIFRADKPKTEYFVLKDKKGKVASEGFVLIKKGRADILLIQTRKGYRQKGLTPYMFREVFNWIDKKEVVSELDAFPIMPEIERKYREGLITWEERAQFNRSFRKAINSYYESYGMQDAPQISEFTMVRSRYGNGLR